ncbi:MAG: DUF6051 family protein [Tannerellaceae bacterium]|jgi:pimeloyl-ACP methyl ester carboxylesterase|nr:DUF6051 family protein [Tannerellaceae bacterium]
MMDISFRTRQLNHLFSYDKKTEINDTKLAIIPYRFIQKKGADEISAFQRTLTTTDFCSATDDCIQENTDFSYLVFTPDGKAKRDKAIILLHGLNERTWEKYLTWAEYLVNTTGKPVILFPIAFHMNRSPEIWNNPRITLPWVKTRQKEVDDVSDSTFANVALSSRISRHPLRFYASGRESVFNLWQLVHEIKNGEHPVFKEDTSINLFAYSIGALLSQVLLLANPDQLFSHTRLFMFCGGSIFNLMNGNARDILDSEAFDSLQQYFNHDFLEKRLPPALFESDGLEKAFKSMIRPEIMQAYRESFFQSTCHRIRAISLKKDVVIPTLGVVRALGKASEKILEELDFPFAYTHQIPFPVRSKTDPGLINQAFLQIFNKAAAFL